MLDRGTRGVALMLVGVVLNSPTFAQPKTLKFDFGPDPPEAFVPPASPARSSQRPLGN